MSRAICELLRRTTPCSYYVVAVGSLLRQHADTYMPTDDVFANLSKDTSIIAYLACKGSCQNSVNITFPPPPRTASAGGSTCCSRGLEFTCFRRHGSPRDEPSQYGVVYPTAYIRWQRAGSSTAFDSCPHLLFADTSVVPRWKGKPPGHKSFIPREER